MNAMILSTTLSALEQGVVLILRVFAASLVASPLIGRLTWLTVAADRVSRGELDVEVSVTGDDEVAMLGEGVTCLKERVRIVFDRRRSS